MNTKIGRAMRGEEWERDAKTFLGEWEMLDYGKMRRVIPEGRLEWVKKVLAQERAKAIGELGEMKEEERDYLRRDGI